MTDTIPSDVLQAALRYTTLTTTDGLSAIDIHKPLREDILHLWRVDFPGAGELQERRWQEHQDGTEPVYTYALMSVFVVQNTDGTYATDGVLYDEDPE